MPYARPLKSSSSKLAPITVLPGTGPAQGLAAAIQAVTSWPKVHSPRCDILGSDRFLHCVVGKDHAARRVDRSHIATAGVRNHPAVSRLLFRPITQMED